MCFTDQQVDVILKLQQDCVLGWPLMPCISVFQTIMIMTC